jgi:hypothetical protein
MTSYFNSLFLPTNLQYQLSVSNASDVTIVMSYPLAANFSANATMKTADPGKLAGKYWGNTKAILLLVIFTIL